MQQKYSGSPDRPITKKGTKEMKIDLKRIAIQLVALMIMIIYFFFLPLKVHAEEGKVTDSYVLHYSPSEFTADYAYTVPYMYTTPFTVKHTITKEDGSSFYTVGTFPEIYNLVNTTKLSEKGKHAYASIAAYGMEASSYICGNVRYRRINLEDAEYFDGKTAGKLRAVALHGFPWKNVIAIQARANSWLRSQELPEIVDLQSGEAILATQAAIWELTNADNYTINAFFGGMADLQAPIWSSYLANVVHTEAVTQQATEHTAQNIESLYTYLYNLDAMEPRYDAVSEASFENPMYSAVKKADGTFTVTVTVTVNITVGQRDQLTISAACGEQRKKGTVTAAGEYRFSFEGLSAVEKVKLEIFGYQCGGDVYLFEAEGERSPYQNMVGYDSSRLPVYGEIVVDSDALLPEAGGAGTKMITVTGIGVIGSACVLLFFNRKGSA